MRHIIVMTSSGAVGLSCLFFVDLMDMYFISLLGKQELAAAIGFAGSIMFFNMSVSIGFAIAMSALVSKALGANALLIAKQRCTNSLILVFIFGVLFSSTILIFLDILLTLLGATGIVASKAKQYLTIVLPSTTILCLAMSATAALRAVGDPKNAMIAVILGGCVNALLDPLFIFYFNLGLKGAAWATVAARCCICFYALYILSTRHELIQKPSLLKLKGDIKPIASIAIPAKLSNLATPFANAFIIYQLAKFGDDFVASFSVIGRIQPVAYALLFALPSALGPIIGQNFGARKPERVKEAFKQGIFFVCIYCLIITAVLYGFRQEIGYLFNLTEKSYDLTLFYFTWITAFSVFNGFLFAANATLNNLERPLWTTYLNLAKATLGTVPFVLLGGYLWHAEGVLLGQSIGALVFGFIALIIVIRRLKLLEDNTRHKPMEECKNSTMPMTPFSSSRTYILEALQNNKNTKQNTLSDS